MNGWPSIHNRLVQYIRDAYFLAVTILCGSKKKDSNVIAVYVKKKRKDGLSNKATKIAGCSKLTRIIYAMLRNAECFDGSNNPSKAK